MFVMRLYSLIGLILLLSFNSLLAEQIYISPDKNIQEILQETLILAKPGDEIILAAGIYEFTDGLSLDIDNIKLSGAGHEKTILSFTNQITGAQGLLVTSDNVILEDFAIEDTKGDAIKVKGSDGIYFINIRTEWTGGPKSTNGAYGLYPVESKNVLIDGCIAIGASDAGIYVGQSENIIVRNSRAEYNVAGIEIENSNNADIYNNLTTHNTGGILIFDLPDLPKQGGHTIRVFDNRSVQNDTPNFAPEGNIVGEIPRGTGIIVMASENVEIFNNEIGDNATVNLAVVAGEDSDDPNYQKFPKRIQIHDNQFGPGGFDPDERGDLGPILVEIASTSIPDIMWDGVLPFWQYLLGQPTDEKLVIKNNGDATFINLDAFWYVVLPYFHQPETDINDFSGNISPLPAVKLVFPD